MHPSHNRNKDDRLTFHMRVDVPVETLFEKFSQLDTLPQMFGMSSVQTQSGQPQRNGIGAVRRIMLIPPLFFIEETITGFLYPTLIEYQLGKTIVVKSHLGHIRFEKIDACSSRLYYCIQLRMLPFIESLVYAILRYKIRRGLTKIKRELEGQ